MAESLRTYLVNRADKIFFDRGETDAGVALVKKGIGAPKNAEQEKFLKVLAGHWKERQSPLDGQRQMLPIAIIETAFDAHNFNGEVIPQIHEVVKEFGPPKTDVTRNAHRYDNSGAWKPAKFDRDYQR